MTFELSVRCYSEEEALAYHQALLELGQEVELRRRHFPELDIPDQWFVLCASTAKSADDTPSVEDFRRITSALETVHERHPITGMWDALEPSPED